MVLYRLKVRTLFHHLKGPFEPQVELLDFFFPVNGNAKNQTFYCPKEKKPSFDIDKTAQLTNDVMEMEMQSLIRKKKRKKKKNE